VVWTMPFVTAPSHGVFVKKAARSPIRNVWLVPSLMSRTATALLRKNVPLPASGNWSRSPSAP
jgi:hypothetical protein